MINIRGMNEFIEHQKIFSVVGYHMKTVTSSLVLILTENISPVRVSRYC